MIKAVIFDMDGLLIDSEPLWDEVDILLLNKRGHKLTKGVLRERLGTGQNATVAFFKKKFNLSEDTSTLLAERQEIFSRLFDKNPGLMPGAKNLIKQFAAKNLKLGIATGGHTEQKVKNILKVFDVADHFHSITTGHEVTKGKPHPDIFLLAAKKLNIDPRFCLVFEDAPSGVESGKKAGMKVFGINKDKEVQKKLKISGADEVFSTLKSYNF